MRAFSVWRSSSRCGRGRHRAGSPRRRLRDEARISFRRDGRGIGRRRTPDLHLDHVEPARALWNVVELYVAKQGPRGAGSLEGLRERNWPKRVDNIVEHDADAFGFRRMERLTSSRMQTANLLPATVRRLSPCARDGWRRRNTNRLVILLRRAPESSPRTCRARWIGRLTSPMSWIGLSSKQTTGRCGSWRLGIEIEHVLHAGDVVGVHLRDAPHLPGRDALRSASQAPPHRLARQTSRAQSA